MGHASPKRGVGGSNPSGSAEEHSHWCKTLRVDPAGRPGLIHLVAWFDSTARNHLSPDVPPGGGSGPTNRLGRVRSPGPATLSMTPGSPTTGRGSGLRSRSVRVRIPPRGFSRRCSPTGRGNRLRACPVEVQILSAIPACPCSPNGRGTGFKHRPVEVQILPGATQTQ